MIDPRALRTYLVVCRENSISAAARKLRLSQPAVSMRIAQLERSVRASLFERTRSGIVLTRAGQALLRRAESMEALLRDAADEIALGEADIQGPLRIGGTPGALASLLPDAIERLTALPTRFALHIIEAPDDALVELLRAGQIQIAVVTTGIGVVPADIEERACAPDPFDLIVGRRNQHLPAALSLRDALPLPWVLPEAHGAFRQQVDALFVSAQVSTPRNVIRCDSLLATKAIVAAGTHVAILPRRVAAAELATGALRAIHLKQAAIDRQVGIRTRAGQPLPQLARQLIQALRAHP